MLNLALGQASHPAEGPGHPAPGGRRPRCGWPHTLPAASRSRPRVLDPGVRPQRLACWVERGRWGRRAARLQSVRPSRGPGSSWRWRLYLFSACPPSGELRVGSAGSWREAGGRGGGCTPPRGSRACWGPAQSTGAHGCSAPTWSTSSLLWVAWSLSAEPHSASPSLHSPVSGKDGHSGYSQGAGED